MKKKVIVNDNIQKNYVYYRTQPVGRNFDKNFKPQLTPKQMLELGVFSGRYLNDCKDEFPSDWFENAKLSKNGKDPSLNYFGIKASMSLKYWQEKGWIYPKDPRGWFQWYARYYMGRRIKEEDRRQIRRWRAYRRHVGAIKKNCKPKDLDCRKKQRQSLLHWAYDSRKI
jgi:hypothetical protein